jgi:hypothetical protein
LAPQLGGGSALRRHQHMHVAADARGGGNGVQRGRFEYGVVVFRNDQDVVIRSPSLLL